MKNVRIVRLMLLLLVFATASFSFTSLTFARFTSEYAGSDSALIAKWNFSAKGQDDDDFYNKGFTFDLFSQKNVKPMDHGEKYFLFTGGGSDTAIHYDIRMNVEALKFLCKSTVAKVNENADIYAPFIFKIAADIPNSTPYVFKPAGSDQDGWFRPKDITADNEGYFSILQGTFPAGSNDQVKVTVSWQWNTSYYIKDISSTYAYVSPTAVYEANKPYMKYYMDAYDEYYGPNGLDAKRISATQAVNEFLNIHGGPSANNTWEHYYPCPDADKHDAVYSSLKAEDQNAYLAAHNGSIGENGQMIWGPHGTPCALNVNNRHFTEYNRLVGLENTAIDACETSRLKAYDDYDTAAMNALTAKDSINVMFRLIGNQVQPAEEGTTQSLTAAQAGETTDAGAPASTASADATDSSPAEPTDTGAETPSEESQAEVTPGT